MTKIIVVCAILCLTLSACMSHSGIASHEQAVRDSTLRAKKLADSLKIERLLAVVQYPYVKGGKFSGVIPVANPTEIPDTNQMYKLLFDITERNPDSLAKEINSGLDEVARLLNLHIASGIPAKKIIPVVVIHGPGIEAVFNNASYKKIHSIENPNVKLVNDLQHVGTKFIVCGQAMAFHEATKEDLLPDIKISLTAQTVLSNYQLQGYVLYQIREN